MLGNNRMRHSNQVSATCCSCCCSLFCVLLCCGPVAQQSSWVFGLCQFPAPAFFGNNIYLAWSIQSRLLSMMKLSTSSATTVAWHLGSRRDLRQLMTMTPPGPPSTAATVWSDSGAFSLVLFIHGSHFFNQDGSGNCLFWYVVGRHLGEFLVGQHS